VPHRHRAWVAGAGPGAVPPPRTTQPRAGGTASVTAPGRRSASGPVPGRTVVRPGGPLTVPHVAVQLAFTRAFGRVGSPDCSAARGPDATCTVAAWWEQFRAGSVTERSPQWAVLGVVPWTCQGQESGPVPGLPRRSSSLYGPRAADAGPGPGQVVVTASIDQPALEPGPRGSVSHTAGGVLTGPRPAPAAAPGHEDRAQATRTTPPPEPRAGRRSRSEPALRAAGPDEGGLAPTKGP
jgi:hypothetical protein